MKRKITTPKWVNGRTLYEVNLRQYTEEGTINAFEVHLPRLKKMGIGIIWFMPLYPIGEKNRKGTLGSYYSISNYTSINPEFGTLAEFRSLVQKIHDMGMKVIVDWVANHTAWDHQWTASHPEYYSKDESGCFIPPVEDWEDVIHLDYGNHDLWDAMIDQMAFWIHETDVDGFRCDMAHLVSTHFWNRARRELDRIKPVYMLAESENHDLLEYAFDTIYNWNLLHAMDGLAAGKVSGEELMDQVLNELGHLPEGATLLNFTSNHDENSWQGSAIERVHHFLEPLTILTFLTPGIPLLYSGQEAGNYKRLKFFDKDEITWKEDKMFLLYERLAELKLDFCTSVAGNTFSLVENDSEGTICSFVTGSTENRLIIFLNLSGGKRSFYITCGNFEGQWTNSLSGEQSIIDCRKQFEIEPYGYQILHN